MTRGLTIFVLWVLASTGQAAAQDAVAGESLFKKCAACHEIGEKAKNKLGPELNGLNGRLSGSLPNYKYSEANKNWGVTWNEASFVDYIRDPQGKMPGTKMRSSGIMNEQEARDLWAFLAQFGLDGRRK
jgi:cytochrome c